MTILRALFLITYLSAAFGCASVRADNEVETNSATICGPGVDLGATAVVLTPSWRPDQKTPEEREEMARAVIESVFLELPCGVYVSAEGGDVSSVDTIIEVTLREFGPHLVISVPVLWSTYTDIDASIRVVDVASTTSLFSASERRKEGGAFAAKSLSDVPAAFRQLLEHWIGDVNASQSP